MPLSGVEYTEFAPSTIFKTVECAGYALSISTGSFAVFDPTTNTSRAFSWPAFYPYYVGAWSHAGKVWTSFAWYGYSPTYFVSVDPASGLVVTKTTFGGAVYAGIGDYLFSSSNKVYRISTDTTMTVAGVDRGIPAAGSGRLFGAVGTTLTELSPDTSLTIGSSWTLPLAPWGWGRAAGTKIYWGTGVAATPVVGFDTATDTPFAVAATPAGFPQYDTQNIEWTPHSDGYLYRRTNVYGGTTPNITIIDPSTGRWANEVSPSGRNIGPGVASIGAKLYVSADTRS